MIEPNTNTDESIASVQPRKEWIKPAIRILAAGSAELNIGALFDNADLS